MYSFDNEGCLAADGAKRSYFFAEMHESSFSIIGL